MSLRNFLEKIKAKNRVVVHNQFIYHIIFKMADLLNLIKCKSYTLFA